jgi:hypothetical protein
VKLRLGDGQVAATWQTDAPCDASPADATFPATSLAAELAKACKGAACLDEVTISFPPTERAEAVLAAFAASAGAASKPLRFSVHATPESTPKHLCGEPLPAPRDPSKIQQTVRAGFGTMRACYDDGLRRDPKLAGKVAIKFTIAPDGHVEDAAPDATTDLPDKVVVQCVVDAFKPLTFVKAYGKTNVVYPINFSQ